MARWDWRLEGGAGEKLGGGQDQAEDDAGRRTDEDLETAAPRGAPGQPDGVDGQHDAAVEDGLDRTREDHEAE
jgi:hypothetical protein